MYFYVIEKDGKWHGDYFRNIEAAQAWGDEHYGKGAMVTEWWSRNDYMSIFE